MNKNIKEYGNEESNNNSDKSKENITFYYNREERLKKLKKLVKEKKHVGLFKKGGKRTLLVILADILIISLFIYFLNRPANYYIKKNLKNILYEFNISGIKGKKVMFAITITNMTGISIKLPKDKKIVLSIDGNKKIKSNFEKFIGENIELQSGESTSVVFMLKEKDLPKSGIVNIYIGNNNQPIFSQKVRFYYFNF